MFLVQHHIVENLNLLPRQVAPGSYVLLCPEIYGGKGLWTISIFKSKKMDSRLRSVMWQQ